MARRSDIVIQSNSRSALRKRASSVSREYVCLPLLILVLIASSMARAEPPARPAAEDPVPNLLGATGLLLIPSAYLQRDHQLSAFVAGTSDSVVGGVTVGARNRLELSVMGLDTEGG